jgi:hypothetical protein
MQKTSLYIEIRQTFRYLRSKKLLATKLLISLIAYLNSLSLIVCFNKVSYVCITFLKELIFVSIENINSLIDFVFCSHTEVICSGSQAKLSIFFPRSRYYIISFQI